MAVEFWVNDELVVTEVSEGKLLLDFLRKDLAKTGTKEGCKEGDCGACSVMLGELKGSDVDYRVMTSCLIPLGEVHGKHVVTVEGVALSLDQLNPVQAAMVERGGSQCGYCTPGFIVSMTWWMLGEAGAPTLDGVKRAVSGNLCRCTGYNSIKRAGEDLVDHFSGKYKAAWESPKRLQSLVEAGLLPTYFSEVAARLKAIQPQKAVVPHGQADFYIGGGTDLYVQRGEEIPQSTVTILNRYPQMRGIEFKDGYFVLGSLTTFEEFAQHPELRRVIPSMDEWMWLIASLHLRNRATIAGNIVNASPIGDMSNLLLALDAELVMVAGDAERIVPLKSFYKGYKVYDKRPHEIITQIRFPDPDGAVIRFEKVSKRKALDIASVNSGAKLKVENGVVVEASLSAGGVAAHPLWLKDTGDFLKGKALNLENAAAALEIAMSEVSPISDVRGSADYKRLLTRQFLVAHLDALSDAPLAEELI